MKRSFYMLPLMALSMATYAQDEAAPAADAAPAAAATADAAAPEAKEEEEKIADGNIARREGEDKATDATLRLRKKIAEIDKQLGNLTSPSRPLLTTCKSATSRAERNLPNIDKMALEIADLQDKFNQAGSGDYQFEKVSMDERMQYVRDGEAAYKAMLIDMKEKKSKRKIGGLDKFEIMRERYQGIPEYTQAHDWYIKTLKKLNKTWKKQSEAEQTKRKNLLPAKRQAMQEADDAELAKLAEKFSADGEDIASVWYTPSPRNASMLRNCINKVEDALRRNEKEPLDKQVGTIPTLLADCWATMDNARNCMIAGNLEEADKLLKEDASFKLILKLKNNLFPREYREPLVEQHGDMAKEVQKRLRDYKSLKGSLERRTATMERTISSDEAQLNNALAQIEKERDNDAGEQTMEIDNTADDEEKDGEADGEATEAPAEDGAEAPAEEASDEKA
ncbi:MAG: hypothetical protein MJ051_00435 [Akkermansia sp.]|nr:hypothetical protein [Akkermansia sp.]